MTTTGQKAQRVQGRKPLIVCAIVVLSLAVVVCLVGLIADVMVRDQALPGTTLAGEDVSYMSEDEIKGVIAQVDGELGATLTVDGVSHHATGKDLGATINVQASADHALTSEGRTWWVFRPWTGRDYPLQMSLNTPAVQKWLTTTFGGVVTEPVNATVIFNADTGQYDLTPGVPGRNISQDGVDDIRQAMSFQVDPELTVTISDVEPAISDEVASAAQTEANALVATPFALTNNDETLYTFSPSDIASVLSITVGDERNMAVEVDTAGITTLLTETVAPQVNVAPTDEKVYVDSGGKTVSTVATGENGRELTQVEVTAHAIADALASGETSTSLSFAQVDYQTTKLAQPTGESTGRWADVDLTTQMVTLMDGDSAVAAFSVSTGAQSHPTPAGTYTVRTKTQNSRVSNTVSIPETVDVGVGGSQDLYRSGNNYDLIKDTNGNGLADKETWSLGVKYWVGFDPSGRLYGFHDAYWHNNFGQAVSHGCVNMREDDVKYLFDWLPNGAVVRVHT